MVLVFFHWMDYAARSNDPSDGIIILDFLNLHVYPITGLCGQCKFFAIPLLHAGHGPKG